MNTKHMVKLSSEDKAYAHKVLEGKASATRVKKRANILLLLDGGVGKPETYKQVAARCGVTDPTVWRTAKEYCEGGVEHALSRRKLANPPRPAMVTGEKEARIIALACREPPEGYPRWTVRLLTEKVVELSIVLTASRETIRRTLKKQNNTRTGGFHAKTAFRCNTGTIRTSQPPIFEIR